jgi:hypothetical protein
MSDPTEQMAEVERFAASDSWHAMAADLQRRAESLIAKMTSADATDQQRADYAGSYREIQGFLSWPADRYRALERLRDSNEGGTDGE